MQLSSESATVQWRVYGHDPGGMRFSPLTQINFTNVQRLQRVWTYELPPNPGNGIAAFESTPLMIGDNLYFATATGQAIAINAETGKQIWIFDPPHSGVGQNPVPNRGIAYWEDPNSLGRDEQGPNPAGRIFYVTPDARLFSIEIAAGRPSVGFGVDGAINLRQGVASKWPKLRYDVSSPPVIYKDLIIVGSEVQEFPSHGPSGAIRAFNALTGKLVWKFNTVPGHGEVGHDTWQGNGWKDRSGVNAWGPISLDLEHGIVFLSLGSPAYDFYGADRKGKDLFGNSLIALNAWTGKLIWYYQIVHHDLWDYDLSAQPVLMTVHRDGKDLPAVAEVTKTGFVFVFDRLTGKPLFPIEERPVPKSQIPGEESWPTQPFPLKPPPLATQTVTPRDITTITPESRKYCLENFASALPGRIFNPWGSNLKLEIPGTLGGSNWSGASFDPASGYLFVNVSNVGTMGQVKKQPPSSAEAYLWGSKWGTYARFWDDNHYPCQRPPWGTLNAVNLNTGDIAWQVPLGVVDALEKKGIPKTGIFNLGGSIATAGGLVFIGATSDHRFRAFDSKTGKELWVTKLESNAHATPVTYLGLKTKKQFLVIAIGPGGNFDEAGSGPTSLVAYTLFPKGQTSPAEAKLQAELLATKKAQAGARSQPPSIVPPLPAPKQPFPFSHKRHVTNAGMKCEFCHQQAPDGKQMQITNVPQCMLCHQTVLKADPEIEKLAQLQKNHQELSWKRVYQLPDFVSFSHQKHIAAKVGCQVCHGATGTEDSLRQDKEISMVSCVNCHKLYKASTSCSLCHNVGY